MSEVNPSSPPAHTSKTTEGPLRVVIKSPPKSLSEKLLIGSRFEATLSTTAQRGHCNIISHLGSFKLQTSLPLPSNSKLELQLVSKGNHLQFLITTINGLAPLKALRALNLLPVVSKNLNLRTINTNNADASLNKSKTSLAKDIKKITENSILTNSVLSDFQRSIIGQSLIATLLESKANNIKNRATSGYSSETVKKIKLQDTVNANKNEMEPSLTKPTGIGSLAHPKEKSLSKEILNQTENQHITTVKRKSLPIISQITVQIKSLQLTSTAGVEDQTQSGSGPLVIGSILNGIVTEKRTPKGQQIVKTQIGTLAIATKLSLPAGSKLTFQVIDLENLIDNSVKEAQTDQSASLPPLVQQWTNLQNAIYTLNQSYPAAAQQLIHAVIPHPGPTLGGNIIFFIAALSSGNLSNWFGDFPTRALQQSKPELLARLKKDFNEIDLLSNKSSSKEWRTTMIPFHDNSQIIPLRLSISSNSNEKNKSEKKFEGGTNFLIDLDLKGTGRFQIDGLVYHDRNRVDLTIRTKNKLPLATQNGIRNIFQESTDSTGLMGGVVFQSSPADFVETLNTMISDGIVGSFV